MPDVTERLDEEGVDLLVQPEFFVSDTIRTTGPWAPDNIKGAGYSDVLRWPSIEALVLPRADRQRLRPLGRQPAGDRGQAAVGRDAARARSWASRARRGSPPCSPSGSCARNDRRPALGARRAEAAARPPRRACRDDRDASARAAAASPRA